VIQHKLVKTPRILRTEILHHNLIAVRYSLLASKQRISILVYGLLVDIEYCNPIEVRYPGRLGDLLLGIFYGGCCRDLNRLWELLDRFLASCDFVSSSRNSMGGLRLTAVKHSKSVWLRRHLYQSSGPLNVNTEGIVTVQCII
jgi:hypothetical protein